MALKERLRNTMAKDSKGGKIQFVFVNVEGDQETLQETLRTVGSALQRGMNPTPRTLVAVPVPQQAIGDGQVNGNGNAAHQVYEVSDGEAETDGVGEQGVQGAAPQKPKRKTRYTTPNVLDLDLNAEDVSLKEYLQQKGVGADTQDSRKYLVIAAWFKEHGKLDTITQDHIYTCFRFMGWHTPKDVAAPLRGMKNQNSWFDKGKEPGSYKINHIGLNVVISETGNQATG